MRITYSVAILIGLLAFLQYRLWFQPGGIKDMVKLNEVLAEQESKNDKLKKQNDELAFQIRRLQTSQDATESRARSELGMVKKDETFYQIVK
jgi:cell division protein FtsB